MGDEGEIDTKKKTHRERHSGRKAEKKKNKDKNVPEELTDRQRNPKAFAFNSAIRAERRFRRKQDIDTKKQHIPLVDRTPIEPPPILVAIVGPPKVGKTTVINNLIRLFTKSPLTDVKGPVTVVIGKKRRITLIECNNDVNCMIDIAKVADLVLLLCDASFGFEMEIFEFLNICQVHGMPRIMGVLTHLDMIKNTKALKNTKKTLKHRFWTEVYPGAKLFYLSGIIHGEYLRNEIKNLGRFISVMKFRPLTWRSTHSYLLIDRYEDLTNQEIIRKNPKCDRNISLYGYIRGVPLKKESSIHIPGMGDLRISDLSFLNDPCPLPEQIKKRALIEKEKLIYAPFSGVGGIVYDKDAVYVELGGSHSYKDKDERKEENNIKSGLIDTKETLDVKMEHSELKIFTESEKITAKDYEQIIDDEEYENENIDTKDKINYNKKIKEDDLELELKKLRKKSGKYQEEKVEMDGRTRRKVIFDTELEDLADSGEETDPELNFESMENQSNKSNNLIEQASIPYRKKSDIHNKITNVLKQLEEKSIQEAEESNEDFDEEDEELKANSEPSSDDDEDSIEESNDNDMDIKWKENLAKKATDAFLERQNTNQNLMKLVYGVFDVKSKQKIQEELQDENEEDEEIGGLFKKVSHQQQKEIMDKESLNLVESSLIAPWDEKMRDWTDEDNKTLIINCFVTGKWKESEDANELLKLDDAEDFSDSEVFGDFEDLETGEKHTTKQGEKRKLEEGEKDDKSERSLLAEKKRKLKEKFDSEYDNNEKTYYDELKSTAEKQSQLNKSCFENMDDDVRVQIEGYRAGMYVRLELQNIPCEFVEHFDPTYPVIVGALNMGEENIGYVNVKIKKHRWYSRILKTSDPLIVSLGWRRFQTVPMYSKLEDDMKYRYLKYTPQHLSCNAHFYGPITPQGTGFLALQSVESNPEILKNQGFRIAATGVVQELDKSTQIMKKLKLVGYPLKIYKKTAFIKDMFNSALEVARFEGAKIKTVSGVRGQIKKPAQKPEGCFRATFEDKIKLSDIVFCRTWFKVDVPKFYNPLTTLLLPPDQKNAWKGARTTGQIKKENNIKNQENPDNLYEPIVREEKPLKPLTVPKKLQQALPYRDKPKHGVKSSEKKKNSDKIAVIMEPKEQKITNVMKMIKTVYNHKQDKLKQETKERIEKHRKMVEAQEALKDKKLKEKKKEVFRTRSKAQIRQEKRGK